jgi:hypothetical protein
MNCSQCGAALAEGSAACPQCGTPVSGGQPQVSGAASPAGGATAAALQGFSFDAGRLSQADKITGIASVVLLISLFLPWFSWSDSIISISINGMTAHGYLWLVFLLCLAIVAFLVLAAGFDQMPVQLPLDREMLLLVATGINLLLVLIAFFLNPVTTLSTGVGWSFGAIIALIAAIVACAPLAIPVIRARSARA